MPIPDGPPYRIRPIHVEDYADLVIEAAASGDDYTIDAVGPDRPEFGDLIHEVADATRSRAKALRLPMATDMHGVAFAGRKPRALDHLNPTTGREPQQPVGERAHVRLVDDVGEGRARTVEPRETDDAGPVERDLEDPGRGGDGRRPGVDNPEAVPPAGKRIVPAKDRNQAGAGRVRPDGGPLGPYLRAVMAERVDGGCAGEQGGGACGQETGEGKGLQHPRTRVPSRRADGRCPARSHRACSGAAPYTPASSSARKSAMAITAPHSRRKLRGARDPPQLTEQ